MFTGTMPLEKFKRVHSPEYQRLVESEQLAKYLGGRASQRTTFGFKSWSFTLMAVSDSDRLHRASDGQMGPF